MKNARATRAHAARARSTQGAPEARSAGATAAPSGLVIRPARRKDTERVWELLRGLAVYEKLEHRVTGSPRQLARHLFGPRKIVDCLVAEQDSGLIGYAMYYLIYSSFRAQPMMWLEDIFVEPERRGSGAGRALLNAVAREAARRGCWRLSWAVLDWNEPAIGFYEAQGAVRDEGGWYVYQFDEARLSAIAGETER